MTGSVLHFSFNGEYVLLPSLHLDSWPGFLATSFFTITICLIERLVTTLSEERWTPSFLRRTPRHIALWRTVFFWIANFLRLTYMIIAMSQNAALLLIIVTSLSAAQFAREMRNLPREMQHSSHYVELAETNTTPLSATHIVPSRPRSRSKPEDLFIHPLESNVSRADAAAISLGLSGSTERVRNPRYGREDAAWEAGSGKDAARALLGSVRQREGQDFGMGDDSDSESTDP